MKYQLVFQFPESMVEYDDLIALENLFIESIGGSKAEVDGHDIGAGEVNIFILTDDPIHLFDEMKKVIKSPLLQNLKSAYKEVHGENYNILWPPTLKEFHVV